MLFSMFVRIVSVIYTENAAFSSKILFDMAVTVKEVIFNMGRNNLYNFKVIHVDIMLFQMYETQV